METIKIWTFTAILIYLALKITTKYIKHRKHLKQKAFKYGLIMMIGFVIAVPLVTAQNVAHPIQAASLAGEMGFKGYMLKRHVGKIDKKGVNRTPKVMRDMYNATMRTYDRFVRPNHYVAAKSLNAVGVPVRKPKQGIVSKITNTLGGIIKWVI